MKLRNSFIQYDPHRTGQLHVSHLRRFLNLGPKSRRCVLSSLCCCRRCWCIFTDTLFIARCRVSCRAARRLIATIRAPSALQSSCRSLGSCTAHSKSGRRRAQAEAAARAQAEAAARAQAEAAARAQAEAAARPAEAAAARAQAEAAARHRQRPRHVRRLRQPHAHRQSSSACTSMPLSRRAGRCSRRRQRCSSSRAGAGAGG